MYERPAQGLSGEDPGGDAGLTARRTLLALLRYKWLIIGAVILSAVGGFFIRNRFSSVYEAEGKVWITQTGAVSQGQIGPMRADALLPSGSNSWGDLLASNVVLEKTVRELHLFVRPLEPRDDPLFASADIGTAIRPGAYMLRVDSAGERYALSAVVRRTEMIVERGAVDDSIGRAIGLRWAPGRARLPARRELVFSLTTPPKAAIRLRGVISSVRRGDGNVVRITVDDIDPWRAARIVNSLARQLVSTAGEFKRRNWTEVRQTLESQLAYAASALQSADDSLEHFRAATITLPSNGAPAPSATGSVVGATASPVVSNYFNLKLSYEAVARERAALEQTLADIQAGRLDVPALWLVLPPEGSNQDIAALLSEYSRKQSELRNQLLAYTEDYQGVKDTRAALAQLRDKTIPSMVRILIEQLKRREDSFAQQVNVESTSLKGIPSRTLEEVRLTRNVEARTQLFAMLQSRYEEAHLAELSVEPDLSILDSASAPEFPVSSRGRQVFLLAVLGGFGAAVLLALVLDRLDKRIRFSQQVPSRIGLNVLGAIPHVTQRRKADPLNVAQFVESFRSLRLNVAYATPTDRPLMLTITSAGAGEGKSLVSVNLALAFAESGYRTLLIDGDVRRGSLHTMFGADRRPGLIELLRGTVSLSGCLRPTSHANLTLLPGGARLRAAPELVASEALPRLLDQLRGDYDAILVDTAPLAAGMDPHALCVATHNVLFVLRLAQTDGAFARQKLSLLGRFPVHILGTAVNDVKESVGLNSEYSYLSAYAIHDEEDVAEPTGIS